MAKQKWYVVWQGRAPGIYDSWVECEKQVKGYPDGKFKSFGSEEEAQKAFEHGPDYDPSNVASVSHMHMELTQITTGRISVTGENISNTPKSDEWGGRLTPPQRLFDGESEVFNHPISVDAACSGNPGVLEYRGVSTPTGEVIFHEGPFPIGTNNIGEFLALVTALQKLKQWHSDQPVYSDSVTAISWVRKKQINTNMQRNASTEELWQEIDNKLEWLRKNTYKNKIIKWDTAKHGEIKADFGRK